jgi:hypothetical protein
LSEVFLDWENGITNLGAGGGYDTPEAQYDAIVLSVTGADNCGWLTDEGATKVLIVTTDAPFHTPTSSSDPHMNTLASTTAVLQDNDIIVVGLKLPGAGAELDSLSAATGGSVQVLASDGANIASAITAALEAITVTISGSPLECEAAGLLAPSEIEVVSGEVASFEETVAVDDYSICGTTTKCTVDFADALGIIVGTQSITVAVPQGCCETSEQCAYVDNLACVENQCTCEEGFIAGGESCSNINECAKAADSECDVNAACIDTYTCVCKEGYADVSDDGNGFRFAVERVNIGGACSFVALIPRPFSWTACYTVPITQSLRLP